MNHESTDAALDGGNLYAPPQADLAEPVADARGDEFYVVAKSKFLLLFFVTFGLYQLYWFYRHWALYRRFRNVSLWPVPRAIFAIFFTHALAGEIDDRLNRSRQTYAWSPGTLATAFVVMEIVGRICDRLSSYGIDNPYADWASFGLMFPIGYVLWRIQDAANHACGQPDGDSNRRITWANGIWLVLGALFWLLVLAMLVVPERFAVDVALPAG
ncbi:DUF4234 domain-containing protein [Marilutibacter chinensis]|uniref:DUF4234 domain-containing protein n=1 Tax=Marilutibacter chinensis TaxID=2912247 RepID=A0ABS9HY70_9GAMM|nr:DUF4234 domain-containing protein [Lysobacter chinensis]MCF7223816.1 DUF4234 domain-containing protein [Lysobacter chinensis]